MQRVRFEIEGARGENFTPFRFFGLFGEYEDERGSKEGLRGGDDLPPIGLVAQDDGGIPNGEKLKGRIGVCYAGKLPVEFRKELCEPRRSI